jgi:hypothetical protein
MASTAIEIKIGDEVQRLLFSTAETLTDLPFIAVTIYQCNEEFVPIRKLQDTIDKRTEEQYHKELRRESATKEQFKRQFSTNPEWNEVEK